MSGLQLQLPDLPVTRETTSLGPQASDIDSLIAGYYGAEAESQSAGDPRYLDRAKQARRELIAKAAGKPFNEAIAPYRAQAVERFRQDPEIWRVPLKDYGIDATVSDWSEEVAGELLYEDLEAQGRAQGIPSRKSLPMMADEIAMNDLADAADVDARSRGMRSTIMRFIGAAANSMTDPMVLPTLAIGGGPGMGLTRTMALEGAGGAAGSLLAAPQLQARRARLGLDSGADAAAKDALFDAGVSALLGGAVWGLGRGAHAIFSPRARLDQIDKAFPNGVPPELKPERDALEALTETVEDNPFPDTPEGEAKHIASLRQAEAQLETGEAVPAPQRPAGDVVASDVAAGRDQAPPTRISAEESEQLASYLAGSGSLDTAKMAKTLGVEEDAARRMLTIAQLDGRIVQTRKGQLRRKPVIDRPLTATEFMAQRGGLKDAGGELASRDLGKKFVPGFGRLVRKSGMSLDEAREALVEAGYIRDAGAGEGVAQTTTDDVLRLLDDEQRGQKHYAERDLAEALELEQARARAFAEERADAEFSPEERAEIDRLGFETFDFLQKNDLKAGDFKPEDLALARELHAQGLPMDQAVERAAIANYEASLDALPAARDLESDGGRATGESDGLRGKGTAAQGSGREGDGPRGEGDAPGERAALREPGEAQGEAAASQGLRPLPDTATLRAAAEDIPEPTDLAKLDQESEQLLAEIDAAIGEAGDVDVSAISNGAFGSWRELLADLDADREFSEAVKICL